MLRAHGAEFDLSVAHRILLGGRAVWFYLWSLVWPAHLTFIYPRWRLDAGAAAQYLFPLAVVLVLAALWWWRSRTRAPLAAALLFCGLLFPALGVANLYPFRYSFVADHFQYLASIPVIAGLCAGLALLARRVRLAEPALIVLVALPLGVLTWRQAHDYRDGETLYRATLARNPECWLCYNNLASTRLHGSTAELEEAIVYLREALRIDPLSAEAHNNMGGALQRLGRLDEALKEHQEAVRLNPALVDARYNIGVVATSARAPGRCAARVRGGVAGESRSRRRASQSGDDPRAAGTRAGRNRALRRGRAARARSALVAPGARGHVGRGRANRRSGRGVAHLRATAACKRSGALSTRAPAGHEQPADRRDPGVRGRRCSASPRPHSCTTTSARRSPTPGARRRGGRIQRNAPPAAELPGRTETLAQIASARKQ